MATYTYKVRKAAHSKRGITHQAIVFRDGKQVSIHGTRKGADYAAKDAEGVIKFYQKCDRRDGR